MFPQRATFQNQFSLAATPENICVVVEKKEKKAILERSSRRMSIRLWSRRQRPSHSSSYIFVVRFSDRTCILLFAVRLTLIYYPFIARSHAYRRRDAGNSRQTGSSNLSMIFKDQIRVAAASAYRGPYRPFERYPIILAKPPEDLSNISSEMVDDNGAARFRARRDRGEAEAISSELNFLPR